MTTAIAFLLAATFVISVGGLALLIWALANDQFTLGERAARTIFAEGEVGRVEDPAMSEADRADMQRSRDDDVVVEPGEEEDSSSVDDALAARWLADASTRVPVLFWMMSSLFWLAVASVLGVIASVKLHIPEWLVQDAALTFGRIRPAHLN